MRGRSVVHGIRRLTLVALYTCMLLAAALLSQASAQTTAREEVLVRALSTSPSFRVRAQAAVALSHASPDPGVLSALRVALHDSHPSVKEASAAALRALEPKAPARRGSGRGGARYYVQIGEPSAERLLSPHALKALREHLTQLVAKVDGVRLAPAREDREAASRVIARDGLVGFSVESVVNTLEKRADSVRVKVAVVVATYPGRDIRAMLSGSASVSGRGASDEAQRQATAVALESALRSLPSVLESSRLEARATPTLTRTARARR